MKTVLKISKEAKNNTFEECKIYGKVENYGSGNKFKKTIIGLENKIKENPIKIIIIGVIIIVFGLIIEYNFFK